MPRNGSGTYTLPNPAVLTGTPISATWANTTLNDLVAEMTDSLSRSGKGGFTAPVSFVAGSAGAPAITWALDTTSGWYRAGANDFRFSVAGAAVLGLTNTGASVTGTLGVSGAISQGGATLAATYAPLAGVSGAWSVGSTLAVTGVSQFTGNVGIGCTPACAAQVKPTYDVGFGADGFAQCAIAAMSSSGTYGLLMGCDYTSGEGWLQAQRTDGTGTNYNLRLNPRGGAVTIGAGDLPTLRQTSFGYSSGYKVVLIGTTAGDGSTSGTTLALGCDPSGNASDSFGGDGSEILVRNGVSFLTPNAANTAFYRDVLKFSDGNVGIGCTPTCALTLATRATFRIGPDGGEHFDIARGDGFVNLDVAEDAGDASAGYGRMVFRTNANRAAPGIYGGFVFAHTDATEYVRILTDGKVGIGCTPAYALDVTGDIRASGNVTGYSDARIKTNVQTIASALDKVSALRGVTFDRIDTGAHGIGVIAQEVREVVPEVVLEDANGKLSVAYGNLVGVLIEAVKELRAEVAALKAGG